MSITGSVSPQDRFVHGQLIDLIRRGQATSRPALEQRTGLGRKVVAQRVQHAIDVGLIDDSTFASPDVGRPSRLLRFRHDAGVVYAGMIEANELRAMVATLDGVLVSSLRQDWDCAVGPELTMWELKGMFDRLEPRATQPPWALGIGVTGSVEFARGRLTESTTLPGWQGFNIRGWLREHYDAPIWVENETNLMALGEWHHGHPRDDRDLLYLLVDDEVRAALVSRATLLRGDTGSAGTIGHLVINPELVRRVTERAAASPLLSAILSKAGRVSVLDITEAAQAGDAIAVDEISNSVRAFGAAAALYVDFTNPGTVVVAGGILRAGRWAVELLGEEIRARIAPLAAREITIRGASLEHEEGLMGAAILAVEQLFDPRSVGLWIESGTPIGRAAALQNQLVT